MLSRKSMLAAGTAAFAIPGAARAQSAIVRFGASPAATQAEAFYAGQLGIFKDAGITTTNTLVTRSADTAPAMLRGDIDVGSTSPQVLANAIIRGLPLQIIATGAIYAGDPPPVQLLVSKKAPLHNDARAYEHATIAVQSLQDSQMLGVLAWFRQHRVPTNGVKFVEITFPTIPAALDRGEVQAGCMVEPFISANADLIREVPHAYDSLGFHWALGVWFAHRDWIAKDRSRARNVVNALYATAKRVNANPSSIDELLSGYSKVPIDKVRLTPKPIWAEKPERSNIEPQLQAAAEFHIISRPVSYQEMTGVA